MSTSVRQKSSIDPLIEWLQGLEKQNERGTLAELRRGIALENEQLYLLYRVVPSRFLDRRGEPPERIFMLASLFALHPLPFREGYPPDPRRNIGESLRELALRRNEGTADEVVLPEPLKRRMDAILAARSEDVFEHLRHIVRLLKSEEVPIDWDQLLKDLRHWDHPTRFVQRNWSRSFYVGSWNRQKGGEADVS